MLLVEDGKEDWFCWDDRLGYIGVGGGDGSNCSVLVLVLAVADAVVVLD